jgi:CheY-like chemotaxis protein
MIQSATWRARDVVRHLLTFSRKGEESHSPQEINIILKEALKMMRSTTPASIEIREDIPNQLPLIIADPTQIHQVIVNLCKNAVDAMDADGGRLTVRVEPVSLSPEDVVNEPELPAGEFVRLTVSDTGCGIAAEDRERIFDPYFTTKAVDKGTGLGLSVVMGIVKSHGGAIRVTSEPSQGTSVETCFPVASRLSLEQAVPSTHEPPGGDERILFVDDEQAVAELNQLRLESFGYSVTARTDPVYALDSFRMRPEAFDLVITDMTMPKMGGDRLIKEILEIRPDMKIILCTGYSERISEEAALSLGASAFLEKPVDRESLAESVRAALDGRPGGGE